MIRLYGGAHLRRNSMRTSGVTKPGEYKMSITYRKRQSLFTKAEHVWRVEEDTLVTSEPAGTESGDVPISVEIRGAGVAG